jgi:hypothetical protein
MFAFSHSTQEKQKFATQQKQEQGKVGLIILKTDKRVLSLIRLQNSVVSNDNATYFFNPPAAPAPEPTWLSKVSGDIAGGIAWGVGMVVALAVWVAVSGAQAAAGAAKAAMGSGKDDKKG